MRKRLVIGIIGVVLAIAVPSIVIGLATPNKRIEPVVNDTLVVNEDRLDPNILLMRVNQERAKVGVKPLIWDENVAKSAQLKADDMEAKKYYQHEIPGYGYTLSPEMAKYINMSCSSSSENLVWDRASYLSNNEAMESWIDSPHHYKAMINPKYTHTGFGVTEHYAVQHFCVHK